MMRARIGVGTVVFGLSTIVLSGLGRADEGIAQKAGEKIGEAARGLKRGVATASEKVREQFGKVRTKVNDMGLESRIYSRLHWDKSLNAASLELEVKGAGVAILRGTVPDAKARAKAVELTGDTVGVTEVVDQLTVLSAPAPPGAASPKP